MSFNFDGLISSEKPFLQKKLNPLTSPDIYNDRLMPGSPYDLIVIVNSNTIEGTDMIVKESQGLGINSSTLPQFSIFLPGLITIYRGNVTSFSSPFADTISLVAIRPVLLSWNFKADI